MLNSSTDSQQLDSRLATSQSDVFDTAASFAELIHVSVACIRKLTRTTDMPRLYFARRVVRYPRARALAWFQARSESLSNEISASAQKASATRKAKKASER